MFRLALYLLGPPRVERDGEPVTIRRRKAVVLFAYLTVTGESHTRDALATLCWPEYDQSRARASLRAALASLKNALGEDWADGKHPLDVDRETVSLNPHAEVWLDVREFQNLLAVCRTHGHPPDQVCAACLSPLAEAAELYRDDFMAGFTLPDSPAFDEWQFFQSEGLRGDLAGVLERLVRGHSDLDEYEPAIAYARRWVALDPLHESAHRCLMRLYAWSGQRAAALRQYGECERVLQEELNVSPEEETTHLFQAVKEHRELPPPEDRAVTSPLPMRPASFSSVTDTLLNNRYRLDARIGRGGMGTVYRAHDTLLQRDVVVKVLSASELSAGSRARLLREAQAAAKLNHPNVVSVYDAGRARGVPFIVMELVEGESLRDRRPQALEEILSVARQVCAALEHAHAQGIVHRDLKPENVMLIPDPLTEAGSTVKLMDFGLARIASSRLTSGGAVMGTPFYLAPEQALGGEIDGRADLYALGVMLYELTTGQLPFTGDDVLAVISQHLHAPVVPPSTHGAAIPPELDALIVQLLSKQPEDRPASAAEVRQALERLSRPEALLKQRDDRRHNLPVQLTPLVGRKAILARIAGYLQDPTCRLLTLVGPGGSGKTRLALEAAAAQIDRYAHGVYFVSLAPLDTAEAIVPTVTKVIVPTVAKALGFSFYTKAGGGAPDRPQDQLLRYLREKQMLILMDNFEHLLDGVGVVTQVLQTAPGVQVLATSRARLNVEYEHLLPVPGMEFPRPTASTLSASTDIGRYGAARLFLQSARRVQASFELTPSNQADVARICRMVAGMPLGILLAAAWVGMLTPAEIVIELSGQRSGEMGHSLNFLETDLREVPARQRSMRAVFDHSWRLLSERERDVMQALSVFRGGFTREAATHVAGATLHDLRALADKSLLQRDPGPSTLLRTGGRYEIHELLRQYAAEQLGEVPGARETARDRHCAYYAQLLHTKEADLIGRRQGEALAEIEAEIENVRASWDWAVDRGRIEDIDHSLESLAEFYRIRGRFQEGEEAFATAAQRLAEVQEEVASRLDFERQSKILLGKALLQQGRFSDALGLIEKGGELLQQSVAIFRDLGARREMAFALCYLGDVFRLRGKGKPLYSEGLAIFKEIADRRGSANALRGLGSVLIQQGEYRVAQQLLRESLDIFRELGDQEGTVKSLIELGYVTWVLGEYEAAKQLHEESLALCRDTGNQAGIAHSLEFLAIDFLGLAEYEKVKQLWHEGLAIHKEIGNLRGVVGVLSDMGEGAVVLGEYEEAARLAQQSLALHKKLDDRFGIAWSLKVMGDAACGLGDLEGARTYLCQALETAMMVRWTSVTLLALVGVGALLEAEGEKERALELLALILHHPLSWRWTKDRAAPLVAELEAELPPVVVAAAQERGRARDLDTTVAELLVELGK